MNQRMQGVVVILGAILVGLAGGVVIERTRLERQPSSRSVDGGARRDGGREGERRGQARPRLPPGFDELSLTERQRSQIDSIFREWEPRTQALMDAVMPQIRAVRDSAMADVDAILTPEQRTRLREIAPLRQRQFPRGRRPGQEGR